MDGSDPESNVAMFDSVGAYIPCFNNEATILSAISSVQKQGLPNERILVIDDGSQDGSAAIAESAGVRIVRQPSNYGRGAARAKALTMIEQEYVLCCDATVCLDDDFLANAMRIFADPGVVAVHGRIADGTPTRNDMASRWRRRHLFRESASVEVSNVQTHATGGAVVRRSAVIAAGNYNGGLRMCEDVDLGERLISAGYRIVFDPSLIVWAQAPNTVPQLLERYWRWNSGKAKRMSTQQYFKQIAYSVKVMVAQDLAERDLSSAAISLLSPHYQFWMSRFHSREKRS